MRGNGFNTSGDCIAAQMLVVSLAAVFGVNPELNELTIDCLLMEDDVGNRIVFRAAGHEDGLDVEVFVPIHRCACM